LLLASIVSVGVLLLFVFPTRTLVEQRHQISAVRHQLSVLDAESSHLRREVASLHQPATIERIASQELGLVKKGQKAFAVLPSPSAPTGRSRRAARPATRRHGSAGARRPWWRALEVWRDL
jgi:cell division protein FtsL